MASNSCGGRVGALARLDRESCEGACRFVETLVSTALGIAVAELRGEKRGRASVAFARQTAMYLAHVHLGLSLSQVGASFRRDRTTVAHACACVEDGRDDPKFERILSCLESALDRWRDGFLTREAA